MEKANGKAQIISPVAITKETILKIKDMAREYLPGQVEMSTMGHTLMTKDMDKEG